MSFISGSSSAPKAPKPPPVPTQTRRQAQRELDSQIIDNPILGNSEFWERWGGMGSSFTGLDLQGSLDARPDSDFLPDVDQRDFQSIDQQIRSSGNSDVENKKVRNRDQSQSLLDLISEGIQSPTIL